MILLTPGEYPSHPRGLAVLPYRDLKGEFRAAIWASGEGPWTAFVDHCSESGQFSFRTHDGRQPQLVDLNHRIWEEELIGLQAVACHILVAGNPARMSETVGCAIVRACSAIFIRRDGTGVYMPSPLASAHERIEDIGLLEADFPGQFTFACATP